VVNDLTTMKFRSHFVSFSVYQITENEYTKHKIYKLWVKITFII